MEKIDLAIIVVGVIVVAAAVAGAAFYGGPGEVQRFDVTWKTETAELDAESGTVDAGGGETEFTFDVTQRNLTEAVFTTTVNVGAGHLAQDEITVTVTPPGGNETTETVTLSPGSEQATVDVSVDLAEVPDVSTVKAESPALAKQQLIAEHASLLGVGNWTVTVEVAHGGTGLSGDHDVTVQPKLTFYFAQVSPSVEDVGGV